MGLERIYRESDASNVNVLDVSVEALCLPSHSVVSTRYSLVNPPSRSSSTDHLGGSESSSYRAFLHNPLAKIETQ
ncbi:hypothetical protein O9993_00680 [Vibrio lentus]|nr:hypothetical protein [Vibrio lentus]